MAVTIAIIFTLSTESSSNSDKHLNSNRVSIYSKKISESSLLIGSISAVLKSKNNL